MKIIHSVAVIGISIAFSAMPSPASALYQPATSAGPLAASASITPQQGASQAGDSCCEHRAPKMVERTVMVPTMAWEKRLMPCVQYTTEPRQETFTVMHAVPEKKTVTRQCVVMVPETRTRTETYVVCKPVPSCSSCGNCCENCKCEQETKQREVQFTVCVPHTKQYTCDVTVCKYVPEQRTITVDACVSHIVQKPVDVCVCHMVAKKVLVPVPTCCCMPSGGCGSCGSWGGSCW
ncbi:MAG TPA: hypothetical protein VGJ04_10440 [Pirellulales bacterium]